MPDDNEIDPTNLRTCILVITRNKHAEILTIRDNGEFRLPRIEIPRWERPAPHLTREADARWGIEAICLFRSKLIDQPAVDCDSFCYALEARTVRETAHADAVWLSVGEALGCSAMAVGDAGFCAPPFAKREDIRAAKWSHDLSAPVGLKSSLPGLRIDCQSMRYASLDRGHNTPWVPTFPFSIPNLCGSRVV